ncbi:MAG: serine/threonine-protein kinase [Pseudomonadota bacterium]
MLKRLGKYDAIKKVGSGSTGDVYLAHDPYYGRDVAVKVYHGDGMRNDDAAVTRKMFFNEAHMVGMLQHPNILPIYDAGEEDGEYYVVMEHIHGARTLAAYCKPDNLLPLEDVVKLVFKCAKALHYAHSRGVVHRDIKPSNVMLTADNDVRIVDFGIALIANSDVSSIDGIAGSPSYMSPEQVRSEPITNRSDLYSLGVVMYEMITGHRPFKADNLSKLLHQIVYATPQPIHTLKDDIPEAIESVLVRAMQKEPNRRFEDGNEFAAQLTRAFHELSKKENHYDKQERFTRLRRSKFFHDFSYPEIWEVMRAGDWQVRSAGEEIIREGELDDRFYVIVEGEVSVLRAGKVVGKLGEGDCFGETGYATQVVRRASIQAHKDVILMRVSATLLEQASASCQLHFNKVFLRTLLERLARAEKEATNVA